MTTLQCIVSIRPVMVLRVRTPSTRWFLCSIPTTSVYVSNRPPYFLQTAYFACIAESRQRRRQEPDKPIRPAASDEVPDDALPATTVSQPESPPFRRRPPIWPHKRDHLQAAVQNNPPVSSAQCRPILRSIVFSPAHSLAGFGIFHRIASAAVKQTMKPGARAISQIALFNQNGVNAATSTDLSVCRHRWRLRR